MHVLTKDKKYDRCAAQNLLRHQHLTKNSTISAWQHNTGELQHVITCPFYAQPALSQPDKKILNLNRSPVNPTTNSYSFFFSHTCLLETTVYINNHSKANVSTILNLVHHHNSMLYKHHYSLLVLFIVIIIILQRHCILNINYKTWHQDMQYTASIFNGFNWPLIHIFCSHSITEVSCYAVYLCSQ